MSDMDSASWSKSAIFNIELWKSVDKKTSFYTNCVLFVYVSFYFVCELL